MERISALMDGELDQQQASAVLPALRQKNELREAWATYHLIGEAMRGQPCADCGVMHNVAAKLVAEPTVLAPRASTATFGKRWAWPSIAAAAAVATVTWMATGLQPAPQPPVTGFQPAGLVLMPSQPSISNAVATFTDLVPTSPSGPQAGQTPIQLTGQAYQPYLMAHQPFSPSLAIQGLAPYLRSVSSGAAER